MSPLNSKRNHVTSTFNPDRSSAPNRLVGAKLKPMLHCFRFCGLSPWPLRSAAAPLPLSSTLMAPGETWASSGRQFGFNRAVSEPGIATPFGEPFTDLQSSVATLVAFWKPPSLLYPATRDPKTEFSAKDGTRKDLPQA